MKYACSLAAKCRTHNAKVGSSIPAAANMLWTWANHLTLLPSLTRAIFGSCLGEYHNLSANRVAPVWSLAAS